MRAVDKADVIFELAYFFEQLLLGLGAVPYKAEIAADKQRVAFLELLERRGCKTLVIAVCIARNIKHGLSPLKTNYELAIYFRDRK